MSATPNSPPFENVTETTGIPVTAEGASMMFSRYSIAAGDAEGKRVLEIGCGAGQGFGLLSKRAGRLVGGDYSMPLLRDARRHYEERVPVVRLSADSLPFRDGSFDLVLFFEASYYVPDMDSAFREIDRVLVAGGEVFFVNANPQRPDFVSSPYSHHYHTADEFRRALERFGHNVVVAGAFPIDEERSGGRSAIIGTAISAGRRFLEAFGLVPKTLRGRARLKRLVFRDMLTVPPELPEGFAPISELTEVVQGPVRDWKVLYVRSHK